MSRYIATRAISGAQRVVAEAEVLLEKALAERGPDTPATFPNTAYHLPLILGMTGCEVDKLGDLPPILQRARSLLHPVPTDRRWTPYLGETLDAGMATLLAEETIEAIRFIYGTEPQPFPGINLAGTSFTSPDVGANGGSNGGGYLNGPIDDIQLRSWGIALVDGRMPGFAAIVGAAKSNEVAVKIVRELQRRNILTFLCGNVNGRSIIHQLQEEGVEMGYDTYIVPFGTDTISAIYALGFAVRSALTFGGMKGGQTRDILMYNKNRVYAFVLALGEVDDLKYATAAGAINFGFPVIADTVIPEILPTGITTYEHVVSMPFNEIEGADDLERAEKLVKKAIEVRGVKVRVAEVPVPVPYGSAFEGERVRKADMRVEFGGKYSRAFEYLRMLDLEYVEDGKVSVVGPNWDEVPEGGAMDLGIVIDVAGRKMQKDFEPVLERQVHYFINAASGLQHIGQRDIAWIRISKAAADKGFRLEHFGKILHARLHGDFGAIVDKVQVTVYTDKIKVEKWLESARTAYDERNRRLADLTDEAVDEFYSCTLCQSFAPNHVCLVTPQRLGLCGAYNWLDCKASNQINPTGPNQPIQKGRLLDDDKGYWNGTNEFLQQASHNQVQEVAIYSIMENPMTACLTADTEVLVDGRVARLDEVVDRWQPADTAQVTTIATLGRLGPSQLLGVHKNPAPEELMRIKTKSGLELTLTANHEVAADRWGQNGHGPWVRADELQAGDRVFALKHLRLEGKTPLAIDLLPDTFRVADSTLLDEVKQGLQAKFGAVRAAYQTLGLVEPDRRVTSMPLAVLRQMVTALGGDWQEFKLRIKEVAPPSGHPRAALIELTPDLFYLFGLFASDGSVDWRGPGWSRINFTNSDASLLDAFAMRYRQIFPAAELGRRSKTGGGKIDGRPVNSTQKSFDLYSNNFLFGVLADAFGVRKQAEPTWALSRMVGLPESHIAAFLAGVFDGDGSVRLRTYADRWPVGEAYLSHSDEQAARDLQLLLKRLGILSQLRQDRTIWRVEIHGANLRRFAELAPAQHAAKAATLAKIVALPRPAPDKTQEQVLPFKAGLALADLPESQTVLSRSTLFYYKTGRSRPVAGNLAAVVEEAPETAVALAPYLDPDYFLDTVTQVERVANEGQYAHVYNLSLRDINSYLANGIHVKNCGCFECIAMVIPEANGIMVLSREDPSMTPAGMTFSTLAGIAGGGLQTPGIMGVGKYYMLSPKFIAADGGFKRVVWMSSFLKESMDKELREVAAREGDPDMIDKIADERIATTVEELLAYLEEKGHPALSMPPIF